MNVEQLRNYCLMKKGVSESFPFDEDTLVFKVMGKIFALVNLDTDLSINLKCRPEHAEELRERYTAVTPGYHMNKQHWNTVRIDGTVDDKTINQWIDDSYAIVLEKLTKKQKDELKLLK